MTEAEVLAHPARLLSRAQRAFLFEHGYLRLERLLTADWLARLRAVTASVEATGRTLTESTNVFTLRTLGQTAGQAPGSDAPSTAGHCRSGPNPSFGQLAQFG